MVIWRRRRREASPAADAARRQLEAALADLDAARADTDRVDQLAEQLAEIGRRNHLGPLIAEALRGAR